MLPAASRDFLICRFDPFVGLFRFTGAAWMLVAGGAFLVAGVFVGRPYCRWLCPYGALLSAFSRYAWRSFSITPDRELDCGLCQGPVLTGRSRRGAPCARRASPAAAATAPVRSTLSREPGALRGAPPGAP